MKTFGKVIDFDNLDEDAGEVGTSSVHLYWQPEGGASDLSLYPPENGKQDYGKCLDSLLVHYTYPLTVNTLYKWCDLIKSKSEIKWDTINPAEILGKVKSHITEHISVKNDFGRFNNIIHDTEDMEALISTNQQLQQQLYTLQLKYDQLLDLYRRVSK